MTYHPSHAPHRVAPKPRDKGAAHTKVQHDRRHQSIEGKYGVVGAGCTITNITYQTTQVGGNPVNYFPGIVTDGTGLKAYNSGGVITLQIDAATGSLTVNGTGVITGGTIQTSVSNPRVILDGSGLRAFNSGGTQTFNLSGTDGSLTVGSSATITGGTIQTSSGGTSKVIMDAGGIRAYDASGTNTINIDTTGALTVSKGSITLSSTVPAGTGARVVLDATGIKAYNVSNVNMFTLDGTTGLITATGVIQVNQGSSVPWQTPGFVMGGGNVQPNASFEDPTTIYQVLAFTTGAGVTAGTFTLKYGTNSATSALNWNATAAQVQTALNTAGVLPTGWSATCSRGPLPGTRINITFSTGATGGVSQTILLLSVATQSLTGGTAYTGQLPWVVGNPDLGYQLTDDNAAIDVISLGPSAFDGTNVLRLILMAASRPTAGTSYVIRNITMNNNASFTVSGYFKAVTTGRVPKISVTCLDADNQVVSVGSASSTAAFTTNTTDWQRHSSTFKWPLAASHQKITTTGPPTAGTFSLTLNGQTTAAIPFNATSAQIQTALNGLSIFGGSGATALGGPLPGSAVYVDFNKAGVTPTAMTANSGGLTGGTAVVTVMPATALQTSWEIVTPGSAGETHYFDGLQIEKGDVATAFAPKTDEILVNQVTANQINANQLSAITANLGAVTAGTVTGVTITGSTIQTATSGARVVLDVTGLFATDSSGTKTVSVDYSAGLKLTVGGSAYNNITWHSGSVTGTQLASLGANLASSVTSNDTTSFSLSATSPAGTHTASMLMTAADPAAGVYSGFSLFPGPGASMVLAAGDRTSTFIQDDAWNQTGVARNFRVLGGVITVTWPGGTSISTSSLVTGVAFSTFAGCVLTQAALTSGFVDPVLGASYVAASNPAQFNVNATYPTGIAPAAGSTLNLYWFSFGY